MAVPVAKTIPSRFATAGIAFAFAAAPTVATAIDWMPGDILIAFNASADTARTVTITSNPKSRRAATVITAESIPFQEYRIFPRFPPQDSDQLTVHASTTDIKFARLSTKAQPA